MFHRRRRHYGAGAGGIGLLLLGVQLLQLFDYLSRRNEFLPVTLGVLALNVIGYLQPGRNWPSLQQGCISVQKVWYQHQWKRIFMSPFLHSSDLHLYYNMASFIWKAISLEKHFGSVYFAYMVVVFSVATNLLYLVINEALAEFLEWGWTRQSCAVGFSGVIFALKVVTTHLYPAGMSYVMGVIPVPMRLACWVELVLISVLFPHVSFVGHLSGILVGLAFVSGPLRALMELPFSFLTGMESAMQSVTVHDTFQSEENWVLVISCILIGSLVVFLLPIDILPGRAEHGRRGPGPSYNYTAQATGRLPPDERPDDSVRQRRRPPPQERTYTSYTYASRATGYAAPQNTEQERSPGGGDESEEELQEAIQRSLHDHSSQSNSETTTYRHGDEEGDRDLQLAMERSLAGDDDGDAPDDENFVPPPPYNPNFSPLGDTTGELVVHEGAGSDGEGGQEHGKPPLSSRGAAGFSVSGLQSSETVPVGGSSNPPGQLHSYPQAHTQSEALRRRSGANVSRDDRSSSSPAGERVRSDSSELTREELREARMQRFGSLPQVRAPLQRRKGSRK